jgi:UDP:flavonoid glycosyltransferase YjiC (YdhE family)
VRTVKIVISTIFQNGGDATRAIETAKAVMGGAPEGLEADITFISRGSRYEKQAEDLGFAIFRAEPPMEGVQYLEDFQSRFGELIGTPELAKTILQGEIAALKALQPDILVCGFWPIASIAKRMAMPERKGIAFLPLPLTEDILGQGVSFPDEMILSRLPLGWQKALMRAIPKFIKMRIPALRHRNIRLAAESLGWSGPKLINVFRMLESDLYLVNDFPVFYDASAFAANVLFTGPLYAESPDKKIEDPRISGILAPENTRTKVFCSLGSSGSKEKLMEAIKAFNSGEGKDWSGIVLCPPSICPVEEARAALENDNVHITDAFVPAKEINQLCDLAVCHGGQGTLQTAVMSGAPIVGFPAQPEQKINLQHLQEYGCAVMLSPAKWTADNIRRAAARAVGSPRHKEKAAELMNCAKKLDPRRSISSAIWGMARERGRAG